MTANFPGGDELSEAFKQAMRLLAGPVTVITAGVGEEARGLTATAVCSVSLAPPTLLVCVNRAGEAHAAIAAVRCFCVNVLADANRGVAEGFAGRLGLAGADKFGTGRWVTLETGAPALEDALVNIDCEVAEAIDAHTHTVFFGRVRTVRIGADGPPLVHYDRAYRRLV
jgi:flavin reductase (DIM6/NTAB) family NADH-FMN oxidoreductase RutF